MHRAFAYQANPGLSTWMTIHVCYAQNQAKDVFYQVPQEVQRRKPSPGMIFEALDAHGTEFSQAFMIGDMDSDREAAERAGITYYDAEQFDWSL
jgi:histidinol phosphatase-like enzyme